jgi:hypothetical protein
MPKRAAKNYVISVDSGADGINCLLIADGPRGNNDIDNKGHESGTGLRKKIKTNDIVTWRAPIGYGLVIIFPDVSPFTGSPQLIQGQLNAAGTFVDAVSSAVTQPNARYKYTITLTPPGLPPISEDPQIIIDN